MVQKAVEWFFTQNQDQTTKAQNYIAQLKMRHVNNRVYPHFQVNGVLGGCLLTLRKSTSMTPSILLAKINVDYTS